MITKTFGTVLGAKVFVITGGYTAPCAQQVGTDRRRAWGAGTQEEAGDHQRVRVRHDQGEGLGADRHLIAAVDDAGDTVPAAGQGDLAVRGDLGILVGIAGHGPVIHGRVRIS
jgi:hypothetical protein